MREPQGQGRPALGADAVAAGVREDGILAATVTIAGAVKPGTDFDPDNIAELFCCAPLGIQADRYLVGSTR
jgi:hypothetical protein